MGREADAWVEAVLRTLADLSPSAEPRAAGRAIPLEWFRWAERRDELIVELTESVGGT